MNTSKAEKTKARFADVLENMLIAGIAKKISIKQLTEAVGVDRQTFYYHFGTIDDLFEYTYKQKLNTLLSGGHDKDNIHDLLGLVISELEANKGFFQALLHTVDRELLKKQLHGDVERVMSSQIDRMSQGKVLDPRTRQYAIEYCIYATVSMIKNWIVGELHISSNDLLVFLGNSFEWYVLGLLSE